MTVEDRLRSAITRRTSNVEPRPDGLHRIEEKLMDVQRNSSRNRILAGVAAAVVIVAIVVGVLALNDDGSDSVDTAATSTTEGVTSTTGETTTTAPTTTAPSVVVDATTIVFPDPGTSRRFDDPTALAQSFATDVLGFSEPIVGDLAQGDSRSGEVEVRAFAQGNPTTILVRQMEDDAWYVLGASVESIRLDAPAAGATLASPEPLTGAAFAFEGTVNVRLFADGTVDPIAETFVTGRGDGVLGDFSGELAFEVPSGATNGVLILSEASAKDGSTIAATVIRVHF
jgi:hypothetical protein